MTFDYPLMQRYSPSTAAPASYAAWVYHQAKHSTTKVSYPRLASSSSHPGTCSQTKPCGRSFSPRQARWYHSSHCWHMTCKARGRAGIKQCGAILSLKGYAQISRGQTDSRNSWAALGTNLRGAPYGMMAPAYMTCNPGGSQPASQPGCGQAGQHPLTMGRSGLKGSSQVQYTMTRSGWNSSREACRCVEGRWVSRWAARVQPCFVCAPLSVPLPCSLSDAISHLVKVPREEGVLGQLLRRLRLCSRGREFAHSSGTPAASAAGIWCKALPRPVVCCAVLRCVVAHPHQVVVQAERLAVAHQEATHTCTVPDMLPEHAL